MNKCFTCNIKESDYYTIELNRIGVKFFIVSAHYFPAMDTLNKQWTLFHQKHLFGELFYPIKEKLHALNGLPLSIDSSQ